MRVHSRPYLELEARTEKTRLWRQRHPVEPLGKMWDDEKGLVEVSLMRALQALQDPQGSADVRGAYDLSRIESLVLKRKSGLGDAIFAAAVLYAAKCAYPDLSVSLDTCGGYEWVSWIPWLSSPTGLTARFDADVINPPIDDNLHRIRLMADILGVDIASLSFPIFPPQPERMFQHVYNVVIPWSKNDEGRSLALEDLTILIGEGDWVAIGERQGPLPPRLVDCTGTLSWTEIHSVLKHASRVFSVDTGLGYFANLVGAKTVMWFTFIRPGNRLLPNDRIVSLHSKDCWGCGRGCADPKCRRIDNWPSVRRALG